MSVLVVGATGLLGGRVCKELAAQGKPVAGMVRSTGDDAKVGALREAGVELIEGDLKDPTTLQRACQGRTAVISTASASLSRQAGRRGIAAIRRDSATDVPHSGHSPSCG